MTGGGGITGLSTGCGLSTILRGSGRAVSLGCFRTGGDWFFSGGILAAVSGGEGFEKCEVPIVKF